MLYAMIGTVLVAALLAILATRIFVFPLQPLNPHLPALSASQRETAMRLEQHVRAVASVPHNIAHFDNLERAAVYIEEILSALDYHVRWQVFETHGRSVRNIEVVLDPAGPADKTLIVGAHYDSDGNSPGANDNGTGVAALLELARCLHVKKPDIKHRLRLVFFVNEEQPYGKTEAMGSLRHAKAMAQSGDTVMGMIALETMGYFSNTKGSQRLPFPFNWIYSDRGNFIAFIALPGARRLLSQAVSAFRSSNVFPAAGAVVPSMIEGADLSDHWSYHQSGIPALMVTDTALYRNPFYHQPFDTPDTVDYASLARIVEGLEVMVRTM